MNSTPDLRQREDKLKDYLAAEIKELLFDELSEDYIERNALDFLKDIPVPLTAKDIVDSKEDGLALTEIADNMARVIGADTHFPHTGAYLRFFARFFSEKLTDVMTARGGRLLSEEKYRSACVYFRTALILDPSDLKAVFGYACTCRQWYLSLEGDIEAEALIAILKAEALEYYEDCCMIFPDFAEAYYFRGYAYLNEACYARANSVWKRFMALAGDAHEEERAEIAERLEALEEPVKIEAGVNEMIAGRIEKGLSILEPYVESSYSEWWPLHYYLAEGYRALGLTDEAIEGYRRVIALSPSNVESNRALGELYASQGNAEMAEKYLGKADLIEKNKEE